MVDQEGRIRRPVSRVLCRSALAKGSGGTRRPFLWTAHHCAVLATYPDGSGRRRPYLGANRGAPSLFGLAPGGACHAVPVAGSAVRSYRTLSPLPAFAPRGFGGRFTFCGAIPGLAPGGRYPPPCRRGARTFLDPPSPRLGRTATARPSDPGRKVGFAGVAVKPPPPEADAPAARGSRRRRSHPRAQGANDAGRR